MLANSASIFFSCASSPCDFGPLNHLRALMQPVAAGEEQDDADRDRGVVEVVPVDRAEGDLGQHEEDGDEGHPDDADPSDERAPLAERPAAALPALALDPPQQRRAARRRCRGRWWRSTSRPRRPRRSTATGTARRKAKTTQNQMELVGVRVRGLMRCQKRWPGHGAVAAEGEEHPRVGRHRCHAAEELRHDGDQQQQLRPDPRERRRPDGHRGGRVGGRGGVDLRVRRDHRT